MMFSIPSRLGNDLFLLFLGFFPSFIAKECLFVLFLFFSSPSLEMLLEHECLLVVASVTGIDLSLLASYKISRNILRWLANFCVNKFKFSTYCCPNLAKVISMLLFSGTCFGSCFSGSDVRGILKSGSKFSVDMLCFSKSSITMLRTNDSLDIRRKQDYFPSVLSSSCWLLDVFRRNECLP